MRTGAPDSAERETHAGWRVFSTAKERANFGRDLRCVRFEGEVSGIEKADNGVWNVAFERLRAGRQKEGIVLAPYGEEARLVSTEIGLEGRIERDIALVVAKKIELQLVGAGAGQVEVIKRIAVRRDSRRGTVKLTESRLGGS